MRKRTVFLWTSAAVIVVALALFTARHWTPSARFRRALNAAEEAGIPVRAHADGPVTNDPQATARMASAIALATRAAENADVSWEGSPLGKSSSAMVELRRLMLDSLESEGNAFAEQAFFSSAEAMARQSYRWYQLRNAVKDLAFADVRTGELRIAHLWPLLLLEIGRAYDNCESPDVFCVGRCNAAADAKELAEALLMHTRLTEPQLLSLQEAFRREHRDLSARDAFERFTQQVARTTQTGILGIGGWNKIRARAASVEAAVNAFDLSLQPPWVQYRFTEQWSMDDTKRLSEAALQGKTGGVRFVQVSYAEWFAGVIRRCVETKAALCLAQVACCVERYKLKLNRWPEELGQLVPGWLDELPVDPTTGAQLKYATGDFGAVLWAGTEPDISSWGIGGLRDLANMEMESWWAFVLFDERCTQGRPSGDGD